MACVWWYWMCSWMVEPNDRCGIELVGDGAGGKHAGHDRSLDASCVQAAGGPVAGDSHVCEGRIERRNAVDQRAGFGKRITVGAFEIGLDMALNLELRFKFWPRLTY